MGLLPAVGAVECGVCSIPLAAVEKFYPNAANAYKSKKWFYGVCLRTVVENIPFYGWFILPVTKSDTLLPSNDLWLYVDHEKNT